jgi:hypothetical protein
MQTVGNIKRQVALGKASVSSPLKEAGSKIFKRAGSSGVWNSTNAFSLIDHLSGIHSKHNHAS